MTMDRLPRECTHCRKLFKNPLGREILITFAALVPACLAQVFYEGSILIAVCIMVVLYIFLKAAFVKPVKAQYK